MIEKINAWLNSDRDYAAGYELLVTGGATGLMVSLLSSGPDIVNTPKLLSELQKLKAGFLISAEAAVICEALEVQPPALAPPGAPAAPPRLPGNDLDKKLRIDAEIKQLWKEMCHLHGQLAILPEGKELYECARELRHKDLKRKDLYDQLHYFEQNGTWFDVRHPATKEVDTTDPEQLEREIKNAMGNRSKAAKNLDRPLPVAERKHYQEKFDKFDKLTKHLQSQRNG